MTNFQHANPTGLDAEIIDAHSRPHFIQSAAWARAKTKAGWRSEPRHFELADGKVWPVRRYHRAVPAFGTLVHFPRVSGIEVQDIPALTEQVRAEGGGVAAKLELHQPKDEALCAALEAAGWREANATQYQHTVSIDLSGTAEDITKRLKSRTRSQVRKAIAAEVEIERAEPDEAMKKLMLELVAETRERSGAFFHPEWYFRATWDELSAAGQGRFYVAKHNGQVVAAANTATFGPGAWYKDGGSIRETKDVFAPQLMHLRIAEDLQKDGHEFYEMGNIPDPEGPKDPSMDGLGQFKRGFMKETLSFMPSYELPLDARYNVWPLVERASGSLSHRLKKVSWY